MKQIIALFIGVIFTTVSFSNTSKTNMNQNWTCTTNASSATTDEEKTADNQMKDSGPASKSFNHAMKNCRDCTKITCESSR